MSGRHFASRSYRQVLLGDHPVVYCDTVYVLIMAITAKFHELKTTCRVGGCTLNLCVEIYSPIRMCTEFENSKFCYAKQQRCVEKQMQLAMPSSNVASRNRCSIEASKIKNTKTIWKLKTYSKHECHALNLCVCTSWLAVDIPGACAKIRIFFGVHKAMCGSPSWQRADKNIHRKLDWACV